MKWKHIHIFLWSKVNLLLKSHKVISWGFCSGSAVKNLSAMQETQVQFLDQKDLLEEGMATHSTCLENSKDRAARWAMVHGVAKSRTWLKCRGMYAGGFSGTTLRTKVFFFFLLRCLWRRPFWKSLLNLLQSCFCFMFWFFGFKAYWI